MREERKCCIWVKSLIFKMTYEGISELGKIR